MNFSKNGAVIIAIIAMQVFALTKSSDITAQSVAPCRDAKIRSIKARVTVPTEEIIDCQPPDGAFNAADEITKTLIFAGPSSSSITLDCNEAKLTGGLLNDHDSALEIHSTSRGTGRSVEWLPPQNITIRRCNLTGGIRIWGMTNNLNRIDEVRDSSHRPGHTQRARAAAPRNILLSNLKITGLEWISLYLLQGVTGVKVIDSEFTGNAKDVAIYFGAESGFNELRGNYIHTRTARKQLIAIDGSSDNLIVNNRFSSLNHGGIYLFRNCGEKMIVRHNTPTRNRIINNTFYYDRYRGGNPAVYIGSRDGSPGYCNDDNGYDFGSSSSNRDLARFNAIMQNQIRKRTIRDMIRTRNPNIDSPNYTAHNQTVDRFVTRRAGCFLPTSYQRDFILDGQTIPSVIDGNREPECVVQRCEDGVLRSIGTCAMRTEEFTCGIEGSNNGRTCTARCPAGSVEIISAKAGCNLEYGQVSTDQARRLRHGTLEVLRTSDPWQNGLCSIGNKQIQREHDLIRGRERETQTTVSCKEHDRNGGDCHVRGFLFCRTR